MDYSVGSVAALISGNVTPNRPKFIKRALTPTKHQQSPNVTPKSEFVDDRSIFLSPSVQKKKAIVKKSPKRIFQNPDLDVTVDGESNSTLLSPKAEKVKKHLKDDLEADQTVPTSPKSPKSPKKGKGKLDKLVEWEISKEKIKIDKEQVDVITELQTANESTPKKKKKKQKDGITQPVEEEKENLTEGKLENDVVQKSPKISKKKRKLQKLLNGNQSTVVSNNEDNEGSPKKKIKQNKLESEENPIETIAENQQQPKKKKNKNKKKRQNQAQTTTETTNQEKSPKKEKSKKNKPKLTVNPNAITNKDTDSEHESDNEIESENEQINNKVLDTGPNESDSSDEDDQINTKKTKNNKKTEKDGTVKEINIEEEIKRTIFVGNVPFSKKCKKEIRSLFSKHGPIDTIRIRTIPVRDARVTPKLAIIKNELHPERSTVNVYVKFKECESVKKALTENNTVFNGNHLRVTRSDVTGVEHDPRMAVFVGNMPFNIEDDVLRAKFEKCGEIESVRIIRDRKTNAGKGFGYVNFASKDGVELALAMSEEDLTIKNRILRVKRCTMTMGKRDQDQPQKTHGNHQGFNHRGPPGRTQGPGRFQGHERSQGHRSQGMRGRQGRNQGPSRFQPQAKSDGPNQGPEGAYRRIMKKRGNEDPTGGPPSKQPRPTDQPREKKPRKEFVGMTAEKKNKKRKFNKGQKKKKNISEILTK